MECRTRIAPSPTGEPHVGTVYIALFNMVFARHFNGKFILRIEDTDRKRSKKIYEKNILEALKWANLPWDEGPDIGGEFGPYRQSDRLEIYKSHVEKLLKTKKAYKCFATKEELEEMREVAKKSGKREGYDRRYRNLSDDEVAKFESEGKKYVIRLKVPLQGEVIFEDGIKGVIKTPASDIDDQILLKSDGYPTYHFASVVDDHLMKISHVIRGDEWIASTPKHILIYEALGWQPPAFLHMPLLLGKDSKKLSKRRSPTSLFFYRDSGYLPEAIINFLSLMGYSTKDEKEIHSLEDLIDGFDPKNFGRSSAYFDITKLNWLNQQYIINTLSEKGLLKKIKELYLNDHHLKKLIPLAHSRIKRLGDFFDLFDFLFINDISYKEELLCPKKLPQKKAATILQLFLLLLDDMSSWKKELIEEHAKKLGTIFDLNYKKVIIPILFASIMGKRFGPPLFASLEILGRAKSRNRFLKAIEFLGGISKKDMKVIKKCLERGEFSPLKELI